MAIIKKKKYTNAYFMTGGIKGLTVKDKAIGTGEAWKDKQDKEAKAKIVNTKNIKFPSWAKQQKELERLIKIQKALKAKLKIR